MSDAIKRMERRTDQLAAHSEYMLDEMREEVAEEVADLRELIELAKRAVPEGFVDKTKAAYHAENSLATHIMLAKAMAILAAQPAGKQEN